jgi:hypothetical protein
VRNFDQPFAATITGVGTFVIFCAAMDAEMCITSGRLFSLICHAFLSLEVFFEPVASQYRFIVVSWSKYENVILLVLQIFYVEIH